MMTDSTLQRVWDSREAISRQCDFDSRKLVQFYQSRQKPDRTNQGLVPTAKRSATRPWFKKRR